MVIGHVHHIRSALIDSGNCSAEQTAELQESLDAVSHLLDVLCSLSSRWDQRSDHLLAEGVNPQTTAYLEHNQTHSRERSRGRPRFSISREYLASLSFSWTETASNLGVSRVTVYCRRCEYYIVDTGSDLVSRLRKMRLEFPKMGQSMVLGRLRS